MISTENRQPRVKYAAFAPFPRVMATRIEDSTRPAGQRVRSGARA
jgi:hypothetical protein